MPTLPSAPPPLGAEAAQLVAQKAVTGFLCEAGETCGAPCRGLPWCLGQEISHQQQPQLQELYASMEGAGD